MICRKQVQQAALFRAKGEYRRNVEGEESYLTECVTKDKSGNGREKKQGKRKSVCEGGRQKREFAQECEGQGWVGMRVS